MKIGVMGAMPEEINGIAQDKPAFNFVIHKKIGGKDYYRHHDHLTGNEIFLVFSGWGKVSASSVATTLINEFKVDLIIFTGVAGAVHETLKIGDVVLANHLVQHDMDCSPLGFIKRFEIPILSKQLFSADQKYRDLANVAINELFETDEFKQLSLTLNIHRAASASATPVKLIIGDMATGDQFIASKPKALTLVKDIKTATGAEIMSVDMESAAVAQVCFTYDLPLLVIRIMSDEANGDATIDFPRFIREHAAPFNKLLIRHFLKKIGLCP